MDPDGGSGSVGDGGFNGAGEARERAEGIVHRTGLVTAVHHAVATLFVPALLTVLLPRSIFHQLFKGGYIAVLEKVAGLLPTKDVEGGVTPRSAVVIHIALKEFEEVGRKIKFPRFFAVVEDFLEQFLGAFATEEVLLIRCFLVAVARRKHHALHLELHHFIEKFSDAGGVGSLEESGVGGDTEPAGDGLFNAFESGFVGTIATNGGVMFGLQAIHVDAKGEILGRFKKIDLSFEKEGVGAEINIFFPGNESIDDFIDLGMDERFTARYGDHGGAALIRGRPALFGGQAFIENVVGVLDFAAPRAS